MKQHLNASNALSSLLLLLLQIILIFQTLTTTTRAEEWEKTFIALRQCQNDSSNYTSGSKFKSNLVNHLLPTLIANGSRSGFLTASFGKDPDIVYGLVQCRGDISEEDCQNCLNTSSVEIIRTCPNKKTAGLRLSKCLIRYSGLRFFSKLDADKLDNTTWSWENDKPISNPVVYNQQLEGLMTNLMSNASSIPSRFMTGSTSTKSDDFSNIYGLVQCTQDLSITDCLTCLQVMFDRSKNCCSGRKGKWILSLSCQIWYRDKLFFQLSSPPPPPPLIPPPPPAPAPAPQALVGTIIYACFAFLLFHIGLLCVQEDTKVRPAMSSVVNMLDASYALASPIPIVEAFGPFHSTLISHSISDSMSSSYCIFQPAVMDRRRVAVV